MNKNFTEDIIDGSKNWIKTIPNNYAIMCTNTAIDKIKKQILLTFKYVINNTRSVGSGFILKYGSVSLPIDTKEIIISKNDINNRPSVFIRKSNQIIYIGPLNSNNIVLSKSSYNNNVVFTDIIHYSNRQIERQKSDYNAPKWLKDFANQNGASVAYFKLK